MVVMDGELHAELPRRVAVGQEARRALDAAAMAAADSEDLPWLRQVITDGAGRGSPWWVRTARRRGESPGKCPTSLLDSN